MTGWDDLVRRAQPRLLDFQFDGTEGADWEFMVGPFVDSLGDPVDFTGATFVCKVLADVDGAEVVEWTVLGDLDGYLIGTCAAIDTLGLATGATQMQARKCLWYCSGTDDGRPISFWGPSGSKFRIYAAG